MTHCINYFVLYFSGLITTTKRKLDREKQDEHILEVSFFVWRTIYIYMLSGVCKRPPTPWTKGGG